MSEAAETATPAESATLDAKGDADGALRGIDNALTRLVGVLELPIEEHAERYRAVHAGLQDALSDTDSSQFT